MNLGQEGESRAAEHVQALGWRVVARNWRCRYGEMDLVAEDGRTLVFIEVKTRSSRRRGIPEGAVDAAKQARLSRIAAAFLSAHGASDRPCRFDVVAVEAGELRHHKAAFAAGGAP